MGGLAILGSLAGGYSDAQHRDKVLNLEQEKQQRDLQSSLALKLLSDPSIPSEYKGAFAQFGMDSVTAKKLPKFDDVIKSLPALNNPAFNTPGATPQTGAVPMGPANQTIQLPVPPGTNGAPTPAGQVGATGGGLSIPGIPVSAPNLSSQPVAMPAPPPPLAQAGQMHFLTPTEQQDIQAQAQLKHAQEISAASGVPLERVLGFPSKYGVIPYGSGIADLTDGKVVDQPAGKISARVPYQFADGTSGFVGQMPDGKLVSLDGRDVTGGQTVTAGMITGGAPTEHTSTTSDEFGMKTTTRTQSRKIFPGPSGGGDKESEGSMRTVRTPTAPPSGRSSSPVSAAAPASATGGQGSAFSRREAAKTQVAIDRAQKMVDAGLKLNPDDKLVMQDAIAQSKVAFPMSNLLKTQTDYMAGIDSGKAQPSPRGDLALVVAAVRAMNPGTVRLPQKELELELKAGSFGDRFKRQFDNATTGILPDDQRKDLFGVVQRETTQVAGSAAKAWVQAFKGKQPLPPHLVGYGVQNPTAPPPAQATSSNASYEGYAVDPSNGHRIGARGGKWYDVTTGVPIQ